MESLDDIRYELVLSPPTLVIELASAVLVDLLPDAAAACLSPTSVPIPRRSDTWRATRADPAIDATTSASLDCSQFIPESKHAAEQRDGQHRTCHLADAGDSAGIQQLDHVYYGIACANAYEPKPAAVSASNAAAAIATDGAVPPLASTVAGLARI